MILRSAVSRPIPFLIAPALVLVTAASIADGSSGPVLLFAVACVPLYLGVRGIAVRSELRWLMPLVFSAFALRAALGAVLVLRSLALGSGGFTTGDDIWYASAAGHLVRYLRGDPELPFVPPFWNGEYYLMTTYVYVESAVFLVFGQHVLNMVLVNSMLGALTVLLVADIGQRIFGRAASIAAASVLCVWPSIVLWSAVNLRDPMTIFFIVLTLWALAHFHARPRIAWIVVAFLAVWAEEGLRSYVEGVLLFVALLGVLITFVVTGPARRGRWPLTAAALFMLLLVHSGLASFVTDPLVTLGNVGDIRDANQFGRTAFDTPAPGSATIRPAPTAAPTPSTTPGATVAPTAAPVAAISTPGPTPPLTPPPKIIRSDVDGPTEVSRSLAHLPAGVAHTLFAPFPWSVRTAPELAAMPEMALWYLVTGASLATLWTQRRRWDWFVPEVLFMGALLFLLSLGEGNIGTLFRHRAMAVPAAILLASPTLAALGRRALSAQVTRRLTSRPATGLAPLLSERDPGAHGERTVSAR